MRSNLNRHLPHRDLGRYPVHLIYRLNESIPKVHLVEIQDWYYNEIDKLEQAYPSRKKIDKEQTKFIEDLKTLAFEYEQSYDQLLDNISSGPIWLKDKKIAEIIRQSWLSIQENNPIQLDAFCIMPNHVHVILHAISDKPIKLGKLVGSHKKFTSRRCNQILQRKGAFWQSDFFDRDIRLGKFITVLSYVLHNPVKAKLVSNWEEWPHTYLNPSLREAFLSDEIQGFDHF